MEAGRITPIIPVSTMNKASLEQTESRPAVVIVGAGIAGLSAANHLINNGITNVRVLEASNRLGGRMHTANFGGSESGKALVELGANWIHGASPDNSVFSYASSKGLLDDHILLDRMAGFCYRSDGTPITKELTERVWESFQRWESECDNTKYSHLVADLNSYYHYRLEEALEDVPTSDHQDAICVFNCLLNYSSFHEGIPLSMVQVGKDDQGYIDIPGGNIKVPTGMVSIIQTLADGLPNGTITMHHKVNKIDWAGQGKIEISCTNGENLSCDHVICTMSIGCLKEHHGQLFQPALPDEKVEVIQHIAFGCVNKIFLCYKEPFWSLGSGSVKLAWSNEEAEPKSPDEWYKKIFSFDEVLNNPQVLVAWVSGPEAEHMETLSDEDIMQTCTHLLRRFLGNSNIPYPREVLRSSWRTYPYTLGSYSSCSLDMHPGDQDRLSTPLYCVSASYRTPKVLFAGEATSLHGFSTMHGARDSGLREAKRLLELYDSKVA